MSETKINATDWLVSIDPAGDNNWKVVACLTTNDLNSDNSAIDVSSKCGPEWIPGSKFEQTIEGEGFAIDQTGTPSKESYNQLYELFAAKTVFPIRFGKASPGADETYYETTTGGATIETCNINAPYNEGLTFNVTFRITQPPMAQLTGY